LRYERLDEALYRGLDRASATALDEWAAQCDAHYELVCWLTSGKSSAVVAVVREQHLHEGARNLVVKLDTELVGVGGAEPGEFARQRRAVRDSPRFAARHLVDPVHEPVRVGDGRWFMFQKVAAGSIRDLVTLGGKLAAVLQPMRNGTRNAADRASAADAFALTCRDVVHSVLTDWVERPRIQPSTVPAALDRMLAGRLQPGRPLHAAAQRLTGAVIEVENEDSPLPNPFALALDASLTAGLEVPVLVGKAHGDLHVENILVDTDQRPGERSYRLIDLSRYSVDTPLARDPMHLLLHSLARILPGLPSQAQRSALLDLVLEPQTATSMLLPGWLATLVRGIHGAGEEWARSSSLVDEWRDQTPLAVLACALTCLGRPSTRVEDRGWFLRLAARSASAFLTARA
jgi:hypothetical protein